MGASKSIRLAPEEGMTLRRLLKLRYVSRVWVIQELLLAPAAVVAIHGYEFTASGLTQDSGAMIELDWKSTSARWGQYIASGWIFFQEDLLHILWLTWKSHASDPRDRIFGILGLIQGEATLKDLEPNYSISALHTFTGFFAYLILNLKHIVILTDTFGKHATSSYPSWLPELEPHGDLDSDDESNLRQESEMQTDT